MTLQEKIQKFEERTNNIWLVNDMPEDLIESRTDYEELKQRYLECVYFINRLMIEK